jgi:uncharacterized protein YndB with AHSA1/START domain
MVRVEVSATIKRPIEDVFAVMSDSTNRPKWQSNVSEMTKTSDGPIGVGTTWHAVSKMFGRRVEGDAEYIGFEANRTFSMKSATPFPTTMTYAFESVDGGTRVDQVVDAEPSGLYKMAGPLLAKGAKRDMQNYLDSLRDLMEDDAL